MSDQLTAVLIVATIFSSIVIVVRTIADNRLRHKLIEKGMVDENIRYLTAVSSSETAPSSLKWGMVLIAVGAAVLIGQFVPYSFHEEATISAMFIMAGLALISYYFIARKMTGESETE